MQEDSQMAPDLLQQFGVSAMSMLRQCSVCYSLEEAGSDVIGQRARVWLQRGRE